MQPAIQSSKNSSVSASFEGKIIMMLQSNLGKSKELLLDFYSRREKQLLTYADC